MNYRKIFKVITIGGKLKCADAGQLTEFYLKGAVLVDDHRFKQGFEKKLRR